MTRGRSAVTSRRSAPGGSTLERTVRALVLCVSVSLLIASAGAATAASADWDGDRQSDEFEPNDEFDTATEVEPPFEQDGLQTDAEDLDFYAVGLEKDEYLNISVGFDHDEGDIDLFVYDPNRNLIERSESVDDDENARIQAAISGTFYVLVFGLTDTSTEYSLEVTSSDGELPPNDEFEYNNGLSSATSIDTPFAYQELRLAPDDIDFYAVEVGASDRLNVSSTFDHDEADIDVRLYGPDQEIVWAERSFTDNESFSVQVDDGGTHYIEVFSSDREAAWYTLGVETSQPQGIASYTNREGIIDTEGLRNAIDDWRAGDIDTELLREIIGVWRSGEPVG